jgi:tetratricopeptide (TPR) repeat protein
MLRLISRSLLLRGVGLGTLGLGTLLPVFLLAQSTDKQATHAAPPITIPSAAADAPSPLMQALILYRKGDFGRALQKYQAILQEEPKSADAYAGVIRIYLKQQNLDLADQTVTEALALNDAPLLHEVRGEVYFRQGRITDAEKEWVSVANSYHPYARAYLGLARVRESISLYHGARLMIEKAHQLDPTDPDIQREWINTLGRAERIKYLTEFLASESNDDEQTRGDTRHYLEYLIARQKEPKRVCSLISSVTSTQTDLRRLLTDPIHLRGYGLNVVLNGRNAALLLDTGSSGILVDRGIAEKAGITRISDTRIGGIGDKGSNAGWVGLASSIKVGNLEFHDCPVRVIEKRSVAGEEGLIGADVFDDFLVDIDFPNEKLRLSQLPQRPDEAPHSLQLNSEEEDDAEAPDESPSEAASKNAGTPAPAKPAAPKGPQDAYIAPEMKSYTRVFRFGHILLVPTRVGAGDSPAKLFILDTGALTNHITPRAAREVTKVHNDSDMIVQGVSGRVNRVYSADKAMLQFGHLRQENQDLLSFNLDGLSNDVGTEVSGTLGFVMLRMLDVKIDYRDGLVDFGYKPR